MYTSSARLRLPLRFKNFTEKAEILVKGLVPYREYTVYISSCLVQDSMSCGNPRTAKFRTAVGGKDLAEMLNSDVHLGLLIRSILGASSIGTILRSPLAPSEPTNLRLAKVNETRAVVSWRIPRTRNGPIDGYEIAIAPTRSEAPGWVDARDNRYSFALSNLTAGAEYTVQVVAYNFDENLGRRKSKIGVLDFSTRE